MTRILLALLAFYRRWLSPALHALGAGGCRHLPTCSEYAAQAIAMHGPARGTGLALWRLLRCHPFARGGLDPVPPVRVRNGRNADGHLLRSAEPTKEVNQLECGPSLRG